MDDYPLFLSEVSAKHRYTEEELGAIAVSLLRDLLAYEKEFILNTVLVCRESHQ